METVSEVTSSGARILTAALVVAGLTACGEVERPEASSLDAKPAWFANVTDRTGIDFRHAGGSAGSYATPENIGSGGALFDYDGDGDVDVYLVDIRSASEDRRNRLFRQDAGGGFSEATSRAGLGDPGYGMGAVFGDVDNDGDPDLLLTNLGPDRLYLNDGKGSFHPGPTSGLDRDSWSTSACFLDYDRDGRLDLYVATYLRFEPEKRCTDRAGNPEFCGPEAFRGIPDQLFRGRGDGSFTEVSAEALPGRPANKALGLICDDLDGDDHPDIYVANDGEENQLWINQGDGSFLEQGLLRGAALNLFGRPEASMGVAGGDFDGDLDLDLFMTHLDRETNTFYVNLGDGSFEDDTAATGLGPASMPHTGFGTAAFDADHDGDLDLAVVNGRVRRGASLSDRQERQRTVMKDPTVPPIFDEYVESDLFFVNDGSGAFEDASAEAGWKSEGAALGRGLLVDDLDFDGDQDLVKTNCGSRAHLYLNQIPDPGHWLVVEALEGPPARDALGARVEVKAGSKRWRRSTTSSAGYLSAARPRAHFGVAAARRLDEVSIRWPAGGRTVFSDLPVDRVIRVYRGAGGRR